MHKNKSSTKDFILKATKVHGDRYCYLASIYDGARKKIDIGCKKHGIFSQLATNHLKGSGCPKCRSDIVSEKTSTGLDAIKKKIHLTHGTRYKYNFKNISRVTDVLEITCLKHGVFHQEARIHINGSNCPKCSYSLSAKSRKTTKEDFIYLANKKHSNKYDYTCVDYLTARTLVDIICKTHGVFKQRPYAHLGGSGCPACGKEESRAANFGFTKRAFIKLSNKNNNNAILYVVRLTNSFEDFYKVGITTRSTEKRMLKIYKYKKQVIKEVCGDAGFIYDLERKIKKDYAHLRYDPLNKFDGCTECFKYLPKDLYNILDKHIM